MIRTAILAGILLVLISIAFSRPGSAPDLAHLLSMPAVAPQPLVAASDAAPAPAKVEARAPVDEVSPPASTESAPTQQEHPELSQAELEERIAAMPEEPQTPALVPAPQPVSPVMPDLPVQEPAAEVAKAVPTLPVPQSTGAPMPLSAYVAPAPVEVAPAAVEELPVVNVPTRPVVTPWEAPEGTRGRELAAAEIDGGAPQTAEAAPAPKFMTPEERSRELHRLAREMENTFIGKLAR